MKGNSSLMLLLLKQLISQAEGHEIVFESMAESLNYRVITGDRIRMHSLYQLRRDVVERSEQQKEQFDHVLKNLSKYQEDKVLLHTFIFPTHAFLFFTGGETECNLGYIMLPVRDPMEV
ncbi:hypothetical protein [Chitinophaga sp. RAB17]|uniref:hypothetical protein n=1 Tax=Chitinophaga sp. RAB17 TaxID=3233049 RepID=UPI003F8E60E1